MIDIMYCPCCGRQTDTAKQFHFTITTCRNEQCKLGGATLTSITLAKPGAIKKLESDWKFTAQFDPFTGKKLT